MEVAAPGTFYDKSTMIGISIPMQLVRPAVNTNGQRLLPWCCTQALAGFRCPSAQERDIRALEVHMVKHQQMHQEQAVAIKKSTRSGMSLPSSHTTSITEV